MIRSNGSLSGSTHLQPLWKRIAAMFAVTTAISMGLVTTAQSSSGQTVKPAVSQPPSATLNAATNHGAVVSISAGNLHSCAAFTDGQAACWGYNQSGQLGNGGTTTSYRSVDVVGITNATAVDAGDHNSCALLSSGSIKCWGANNFGQLGDGTHNASNVPVSVSGITTATAIASGSDYASALLANHTINCWGRGSFGSLGNGGTSDSSVPVVVSGITTATAVSVSATSCALLSDSTVRCWGYGTNGALGNGANSDSNIPVVVSGLTSATSISVGGATCASLTNGTAKCWGNNTWGQIGDGTNASSNVPVSVAGVTGISQISAGGGHTCARTSGTVRCWGDGGWGQLGNGSSASSLVPVTVTSLTSAARIDAGGAHTCARLVNGTAQCWGQSYGIGSGNSSDTNVPIDVLGVGRPSNDNFANAEPISGLSNVAQLSTANASAEPNEPDHTNTNQYPAQATVWYAYTAPITGSVTFDTCSSDYDTILEVYTGSSLTNLVNTTYNDDACGPSGLQSVVTFPVSADATYFVSVDALDGFTGSLTMEWNLTPTPPPANDNYANTQAMLGTNGTFTGNSTNATVEPGEPAPFGSSKSVWFRFLPAANGTFTIDTCGSSFDTTIEVYQGASVSTLTSRGSNQDYYNCGVASSVSLAVTANLSYTVRVGGIFNQSGPYTLNWHRTAQGTAGRPIADSYDIGDGWASIVIAPPVFTGSSAITSYTVTTSGGPGSGVTTVPGSANSAVVSGLSNGVQYSVTVQANNNAGGGTPSAPFALTPIAGVFSAFSGYDATEAARVHANAVYFGQDDATAQRTSTFIVGYIVGIIPPGITPVAAPFNNGPIVLQTDWSPTDQPVLAAVARKYSLSPGEAQHFSTQLIGFLLALGGH